jgi:hypothetical protein
MRRGYCIAYNGRMVPYRLRDGVAFSLTACDPPEQSPLRRAFVWMRGSQEENIGCAIAFAFPAAIAAIESEKLSIQNSLTTLSRDTDGTCHPLVSM